MFNQNTALRILKSNAAAIAKKINRILIAAKIKNLNTENPDVRIM
ncbi:hypothetical protein ACIQCX_24340 [Enterobacter cancerogenus]